MIFSINSFCHSEQLPRATANPSLFLENWWACFGQRERRKLQSSSNTSGTNCPVRARTVSVACTRLRPFLTPHRANYSGGSVQSTPALFHLTLTWLRRPSTTPFVLARASRSLRTQRNELPSDLSWFS